MKALILAVLVLVAFAAGAGGGYWYGHKDLDACQQAVEAHTEFAHHSRDALVAIQDEDLAGMTAAIDRFDALTESRREKYGTSSLTTITARCPS